MKQSKIIADVSQTKRVTKTPESFIETKAIAIPLSVMCFSFIHYLISSQISSVIVSNDIFSDGRLRNNEEIPIVKIVHTKSYKQTKNCRLCEYFDIHFWCDNNLESKHLLSDLSEVLYSKLWGVSQKTKIVNDKLHIVFSLYVKTYLLDVVNKENEFNNH